jgi:hypothetical protein
MEIKNFFLKKLKIALHRHNRSFTVIQKGRYNKSHPTLSFEGDALSSRRRRRLVVVAAAAQEDMASPYHRRRLLEGRGREKNARAQGGAER